MDGLCLIFPVLGRGGSLQYLIPILTVLRRKVDQEEEISSCPNGNACHREVDHIYQHAPRFIGIERRHDFGSVRQPGDGRTNQAWLLGIGVATQAGIPGPVLGVRKQHGMGQRINGAFG